MNLYKKLIDKQEKLAVIGLGYVGLPIAIEFAKKLAVVGFDIKPDRIELIRKGIDPSRELEPKAFENCDINYTANPDDLKGAKFFIVAVPTPINDHNLPDLKPLLSATEMVAKVLKKGDYVVYESTVYPGCTEEECVPLLEKISGLKFIDDFKVGFSPERINPGDLEHTLTRIVKVSSGCDAESAELIAKTYELIITAGVFRASTIKVAEAAKVIENTQRDINIAFMNELSLIFSRMGINTYEVLEAAGTKWNFLKFFPGLVGGHCIGVDPYYLVYKAKELGYHPQIISAGRFINDSMGGYIAKQVVKKIIAGDKNVKESRILIMGVTFKENVSDIRNSKVVDIVNELKSYGIKNLDIVDPYADSSEVEHEYGFSLAKEPTGKYDAIIVAVNHQQYLKIDSEYFTKFASEGGVFVDVKGAFVKNKPKGISYWSL
ncbi:MAG: nucleotide sugar dehydrogenase [Bacteroidales bacterium]|jgi:UDP-N-acetyl-D-galactosamine dehydrogenase|nr:nucleotide sugar dehydrogenase [Bacteroidales bacterium]MDD4385562.1 nucleotide sugar dehydrogenase [Bacteroidales bacterium]MDY0197562.1 nucleotide sugar dehydrogenase [Tenuifilaceae bacterium]